MLRQNTGLMTCSVFSQHIYFIISSAFCVLSAFLSCINGINLHESETKRIRDAPSAGCGIDQIITVCISVLAGLGIIDIYVS